MRSLSVLSIVVPAVSAAVNFPFESIQLADADIGKFSAIAFGNKSALTPGPGCKAYPGTAAWPPDDEWARLNSSLGGALLKPSPPGAVCYPGPLQDAKQCQFLLFNSFSSRFYIDDPLTVLTSWPQGDTCTPSLWPQGNCTQGGFPLYVVNATTVKQIQTASNFACNRNVRLVIKSVLRESRDCCSA